VLSNQDFADFIGDSKRIEVLTPRTNPEAMEILARCSVLALPSRSESFGRVLLEAMAAGKPLVVSKAGGMPYLVRHDVNGLLCEREDVASLAEQLRKALASEELQARLGNKGRELALTRYDENTYGRNTWR